MGKRGHAHTFPESVGLPRKQKIGVNKNVGFEKVKLERNRVFLNLGFAKPMFCNPVLFTKTTGITKTTKTAQTATNKGVDCQIGRNQGNHGDDENPGQSRVQNIGSPKPRFRKTRRNADEFGRE